MAHLLGWIEAHPGTAGWVQAVGALVALVFAIAIPAFQSSAARRAARRDAAQQFAAVVKIVQRGAFLVDEVNRAIEEDGGYQYFANIYDRNRFGLIAEALSKVEIHRLPTPGAVECFLDARRHYDDCTSWIEVAFSECGVSRSVSEQVIEHFTIARDSLFANWHWLDEERVIVETGKIRYDLRIATIAGKVIGHGRG